MFSRIFKLDLYILILLGSILPDINWIGMWGLEILGYPSSAAYAAFFPFHTPFMAILLSIFLGLFLENWLYGSFLIFLGSVTHFVLDSAECGNFVVFFYPIDLRPYSFNLFDMNSLLGYILHFLLLVVLIHLLIQTNDITQIKIERRWIALIMVPLIVGIPLLTQTYILNDFLYFRFADNSSNFDGKEILLTNRPLVSANPATIDVLSRQIYVDTKERLDVGKHITVKGIYDFKRNVIIDSTIYVHNDLLKPIGSVIGIILFALIFIKKYRVLGV